MSYKNLHQIAFASQLRIALTAAGLTVVLTGMKLSDPQSIPSGSPTRDRQGAALVTRQDAHWMGRLSLTHFWSGKR